MNMRKTFILCSFLFVCIAFAAAQNKRGKISGTVQDAAGKPLPSISISLLKAKDSSLVKVAVSSKEGKYEFENIASDSYLISTTAVGYEKAQSTVFAVNESNNTVQVAALQMNTAAKGMSEVVVTAKKPFIETKIDKTVALARRMTCPVSSRSHCRLFHTYQPQAMV